MDMSPALNGPIDTLPDVDLQLPPSLFFFDPAGSRNPGSTGTLDITGKARTLIYGPYLSMPAGTWRVKMRFSVDAVAARCIYRFDWGQSTDFTAHTVIPEQAGVYEIVLEYTWVEPTPCEFRIILMQGAFEGSLTFLGGAMEPVAETAARD